MKERHALLLGRAIYNLRGGFLVRPLTIALALGCAGAFWSWIEEEVPGVSGWVPKVLGAGKLGEEQLKEMRARLDLLEDLH